ncbi:altronate hydrolase [Arsukibacterium ikkense]|uniref:Altronate hydrolase n=2 Tax=Arsukibacterium ikkense TaxID=336831 RepID=A0A0M2VC98_9GAMM|nr:altronate hydrolase [Arsukibacterium ikkense]
MSTEQKPGCSVTLNAPVDPGEQLTLLQVHPRDNVLVALQPLAAGSALAEPFAHISAKQAIPAGHKVALTAIAKGESVIKYGFAIGAATSDIAVGEHIHSHNLATLLSGQVDYRYNGCQAPKLSFPAGVATEFMGYRRANGKVGTRNELWIINTVGCVNRAAMRVAEQARKLYGDQIDGIHAFTHPFGCSQLGDDLANTRTLLAGLIQHPNAGGVLVMGLGCENNQLSKLLAASPGVDQSRIRSFNAQQVEDEIEQGLQAVAELVAQMRDDKRTACPVSDLVVGMKCGGSDGLSGLTANPLVGRIADLVAAGNGKVVLTETPEMFGAEQVFMARAANEQVFGDIVTLVNDFKQYFIDNKQPVYENPSPGNKDGGLTTLEEKSLGAIQKGGSAIVRQVIRYGEMASHSGLTLLEGPGNDAVSSTALTAAGATLLLFTTGRGTPLGFPAPTVKISSNSALAGRKPQWIDYDAGGLLKKGQDATEFSQQFFSYLLDVASGKTTRNEQTDNREIAIWKNGVTL